ncbi:MAG TPA: class I SAM-dependent methyltransferase [Candidatus Polarisedimenticolia bacterium]|nr:class I SAM-dependent methyltransferase [Candidatus Polarisedimenticolia bacterium]
MVHLFKRREDRPGAHIQGSEGAVLASHILAKFLKRLRVMPKPRLLDLGILSGANIEFFARAGCRVQVEDLLSSSGPGGEAPTAPEAAEPAAQPAPDPAGPPLPVIADDATARSEAAAPPVTEAPAPGTLPLPRLSGKRPSRRIVLPPRTFPKADIARRDGGGGLRATPSRPAAPRCGLPTVFDYPDGSFDAIVAWDIFNFYDPDSVHALASETRRILKPGGLALAYFNARRVEHPDAPARYQILDQGRVERAAVPGRLLSRYVYQNRDIEKMFGGLRIVELYFLKNSVREILMEKKAAPGTTAKPLVRPAEPKARFSIE